MFTSILPPSWMELAKLNILAAAIDEAYSANDAAIRGAETAESINRNFPQDALKRLATAARESGQSAKSKGSELLEVMSQLATDIDSDNDVTTQRVLTLLEQTLEAAGIACRDGLWAIQMAEAAVENPRFPEIRLPESQKAKIANIQSYEDRVAKEAAEYERLLAACWERHDDIPPRTPAPKKSENADLSSPQTVNSMSYTSNWVTAKNDFGAVPNDFGALELRNIGTGNAGVPSKLISCGHTHQIWPKSDDKKLRDRMDSINARSEIISNVAKSRIPCATHFIETIIEETLSGELNKGLQEKVILSKRRSRMAANKVLVTTGTNNKDRENDLDLDTMSSNTSSSKITSSSEATNSEVSEKAQNQVIGNETKPSASEDEKTSTEGVYESVFFLKSRNTPGSKRSIESVCSQKTNRVSTEKNLEVSSSKSAVVSSSDLGDSAAVQNKASILQYQESVCPVMTFVSLLTDETVPLSAATETIEVEKTIPLTAATEIIDDSQVELQETPILQNRRSKSPDLEQYLLDGSNARMSPKSVIFWKELQEKSDAVMFSKFYKARKRLQRTRAVKYRSAQFSIDTEPVEQQVEGASSSKLNLDSKIVTTASCDSHVPISAASDEYLLLTVANDPSPNFHEITSSSTTSTLHLAPQPLPRTSILKESGTSGTSTNSNDKPEIAPIPLPRKTLQFAPKASPRASILKNVGSRESTTNSNEETEMAPPPRPPKRVNFSPEILEEIVVEKAEEIPRNQTRRSYYQRIKKFILGRSTSTRTRGPRN
ncbi:hypothetical protein B9Z55_026460 [Caenorhabditis nigoni]|uniref:Uncharacterized protein n=2 Tax=Caenorhabditis nigoni TaxID=1611254 RepID=A0A2G5T391_9PELO|nr:hypothetical protein B9Z55_026460 [Caenorhabditis nigoni]